VEQYFDKLASEWEMIQYTVGEFIAQGDRVAMIGGCGWKHGENGLEIRP